MIKNQIFYFAPHKIFCDIKTRKSGMPAKAKSGPESCGPSDPPTAAGAENGYPGLLKESQRNSSQLFTG